jgi:glycerol-3-phosphate acyltransferase PlsY
MTDTFIAWLIAIPAAYLFGAIPTGYLIGKLWRGIDVRKYGSGGTGFTNVMRTLGKPAGITVLIVDILKGVIPVLIVGIFTDFELIRAVAGSTAVIGHVYPVYTRFAGGRGVATAFGALVVLSPLTAGSAAIGILVIAATKYVSAGSLTGTFIAAVAMVALIITGHHTPGLLVFVVAILIFIPIRHVGNIDRLVHGKERQIEGKAVPRRRSR